MHRFLWSTIVLFISSSCYTPVKRNCEIFKTGTFSFETLVGTQVEKTIFIRNDSIEIDHYRGKTDTSSIRWINSCEYIVKKINPKNNAEKKAIHIKILSTNNTGYTFEYNVIGESIKQKGVAIQITN